MEYRIGNSTYRLCLISYCWHDDDSLSLLLSPLPLSAPISPLSAPISPLSAAISPLLTYPSAQISAEMTIPAAAVLEDASACLSIYIFLHNLLSDRDTQAILQTA